MRLTKPRKSIMATWSIRDPVSCSSVRTTIGACPRAYAALMRCSPLPGMVTIRLRGIEITYASSRSSLRCSSMSRVAAAVLVLRRITGVGADQQVLQRLVGHRVFHRPPLGADHLWRKVDLAVDVRRHTPVDLVEIDTTGAEQRTSNETTVTATRARTSRRMDGRRATAVLPVRRGPAGWPCRGQRADRGTEPRSVGRPGRRRVLRATRPSGRSRPPAGS